MPVYVDPDGGLIRLDQGLADGQPHYVSPDGGLIRALNARNALPDIENFPLILDDQFTGTIAGLNGAHA